MRRGAPGLRRTGSRRSVAVIGLAVAAVAAVAVGATAGRSALARPDSPRLRVGLPASLAGLPPREAALDFGREATWQQGQRDLNGGREVAGRAYGPTERGARPLALNLVLVAGDATGRGDLAFAGPERTRIGAVTCTQTLRFGEGQPYRQMPTTVLCWRASADLTVSLLVLGAPPGYLPAAAAAVEQAWQGRV